MPSSKERKVSLCRNIALLGVLIMGVGSFMSCLGTTLGFTVTGNILIILSIAIMLYGFTYWRP